MILWKHLDYGAEEVEESDSDSMNSQITARANKLENFQIYEFVADKENLEGEPIS